MMTQKCWYFMKSPERILEINMLQVSSSLETFYKKKKQSFHWFLVTTFGSCEILQKIGPDRFCRFDVYRLQTNKQDKIYFIIGEGGGRRRWKLIWRKKYIPDVSYSTEKKESFIKSNLSVK